MTLEQKKEMYRDIAKNWNQFHPAVLASKWGVKQVVVNVIAGKLRHMGIPLEVKQVPQAKLLTDEFVTELKGLVK